MQHHLSFLGFFSINQFKKENETQVGFLENLTFFCFQGLFAHEDYLSPFSSKDFVYKLCQRVFFPSRKILVDEVLPRLVKKTMVNLYVT